jgi:uridine kinase
MAPLLVGIAGGSGSGKTTLAHELCVALPAAQAVVVPADAYYRDLGHLSLAARKQRNFDEPAALDGERLAADLRRLRRGEGTHRPVYDFAAHTRRPEQMWIPPWPVIIVEGILVLALPAVREILHLKVFVAASEAVRRERRIARDVGERGRTRESVIAQLARFTLPMHELHVAPCAAYADIVVSGEEPATATGRVMACILSLALPRERA